jgi:hypothetical protein
MRWTLTLLDTVVAAVDIEGFILAALMTGSGAMILQANW